MATVVGFSPEDAKRIAAAVVKMEQQLRVLQARVGVGPTELGTRVAIDGLLTEDMERGGNAVLAVYTTPAVGGLGEPTDEEYTIVDGSNKIPSGTTITAGTSATAILSGGEWLLVAYDCDMEDQR